MEFFMIDIRRLALAVCATASLLPMAVAQTPAPAPAAAPSNNLAALRTRAPTDADRRVITEWIGGQIQSAAKKDPPDLVAFRRAFLGEFKASGANEQFRQVFADLSAEAFGRAIADPANAQGTGALMCGMALGTLADMNRPSGVPVALEGLKHKSEVVRERAASCLLRMRDRVPPAETQRVFDAVAVAAGKETGGLALHAMYKALIAYGKPEDTTKAILAVLDARIPVYEKRDLHGCAGDVTAADLLLDTFTNRRAQLTAETLQRAVQRLAELLTVAVLNYKGLMAAGSASSESLMDPQQQCLELLIDATERAMAKAANTDLQQQSVSAQMKGPETGRLERMQASLDRWIGTAQKPGVLNQQAFGVPVGLPKIKLVPSSTGTRPAAAPVAARP
jgi:hypothetical protein